MDLEEYYDSLDEDSNYGSLESLEEPTFIKLEKSKRTSKIPVKTKTTKNENEFSFSQDDEVPFYDQCLSKSEVDLKKTFSKNLPVKKTRKKPPLSNNKGKLKSNSYLNMFYAKLGVERIDLTNRATCGDLTPTNYDTCRDFEMASFSDLSGSERSSCSDVINKELSLSLTSLDSKLFSVSQRNLKVGHTNNLKKNFMKPSTIHLSQLGSLGPDISKEKLDLLKKRQEYGRKVSLKNKIKMIENKVLQNLQQEIKDCKKCV